MSSVNIDLNKCKSVRLNKKDKASIIRLLIKNSKIQRHFKTHQECQLPMLTEQLINHELGKYKTTWDNLPDKFKNTFFDFTIENIPQQSAFYWSLEHWVLAPASAETFDFQKLSKELKDLVLKIIHLERKIREEKKNFKNKVERVVRSVNSTKQLLKIMPEAFDYFCEDIKQRMYDGKLPDDVSKSNDVSEEVKEIISQLDTEV